MDPNNFLLGAPMIGPTFVVLEKVKHTHTHSSACWGSLNKEVDLLKHGKYHRTIWRHFPLFIWINFFVGTKVHRSLLKHSSVSAFSILSSSEMCGGYTLATIASDQGYQ